MLSGRLPTLGDSVKTLFAFALLALAGFTASASAADNTSLIGNYVVTGTETSGSAYDGSGTLAITMDRSGALNLNWDGGKYLGVGQVIGDKLAVATFDERRAVIMVMDIKSDGSVEGKWWKRTDAGTKGTEMWKKK
jgi:hypothetical protein